MYTLIAYSLVLAETTLGHKMVPYHMRSGHLRVRVFRPLFQPNTNTLDSFHNQKHDSLDQGVYVLGWIKHLDTLKD